MVRLIADRMFFAEVVRNIKMLHPPITSGALSNDDYHALIIQGFAWHPNGVIFDLTYGTGWLTVYESSQIEVRAETERAILVPFEVPQEGYLNVVGYCNSDTIEVPPGRYQLLFERREMTKDELLSTEKYEAGFGYSPEDHLIELPELCILTFVPTQDIIEPQLLRFTPWSMPIDVREPFRQGLITIDQLIPKTLIKFDEPLRD